VMLIVGLMWIEKADRRCIAQRESYSATLAGQRSITSIVAIFSTCNLSH
jgi:hypothetical protein